MNTFAPAKYNNSFATLAKRQIERVLIVNFYLFVPCIRHPLPLPHFKCKQAPGRYLPARCLYFSCTFSFACLPKPSCPVGPRLLRGLPARLIRAVQQHAAPNTAHQQHFHHP